MWIHNGGTEWQPPKAARRMGAHVNRRRGQLSALAAQGEQRWEEENSPQALTPTWRHLKNNHSPEDRILGSFHLMSAASWFHEA